jgi:hypothetical protein
MGQFFYKGNGMVPNGINDHHNPKNRAECPFQLASKDEDSSALPGTALRANQLRGS